MHRSVDARLVYYSCVPPGSAQPLYCIGVKETQHFVALNLVSDAEDTAHVLMDRSKVDMKKLMKLIHGFEDAVEKYTETGDEGVLGKALDKLLGYAVENSVAVIVGSNLEGFMPVGAAYEGRLDENYELAVVNAEELLKYKKEAEELGWGEEVKRVEQALALATA